MRYAVGATALALLSQALVAAQNCPSGYNRTIEWYECPTADEPTLECALLTVPLDYNQPGSPSIPVPLVRVQATTPNPNGTQSIVYNPGGPGSSGIGQFAGGQGSGLQSVFGSQFNFISFDPRGVALSTIFENGLDNYACPAVEGYSPGPFDTDTLLNAAISNFTLQAQTCADTPWGIDGQYVGTPANARDIVAIVQALAGEDGLVRYYGASYGTLLGSTLAAMFPEKMERVILDGNINPTDYYYGYGDEAVAEIDDGVRQFFHECALAPTLCALADKNQTAGQLLQEYNDYLAGLKRQATATDDYSTYFESRAEWISILKQPNQWVDHGIYLYGEYRTNSSSQARKRQAPGFNPEEADSAAEAQTQLLNAVTCGDYKGPRSITLDAFRKARDVYANRSFYAGDTAILSTFLQCSAWETKDKDQFTSSLTNVKTKNPIVFVNGIFDPVTPAISAVNASAGFIGSAVLKHNGAGHCSSAEYVHLKAVYAAMAKYWVDGKIPTQLVYNKTGNSFAVGQPPIVPDSSNSTTTNTTTVRIALPGPDTVYHTHATKLKQVYPRELLQMLSEHSKTIQKRATNSSSDVPAGCTPIGPGVYVGAAGRSAVATSASIVVLLTALLL